MVEEQVVQGIPQSAALFRGAISCSLKPVLGCTSSSVVSDAIVIFIIWSGSAVGRHIIVSFFKEECEAVIVPRKQLILDLKTDTHPARPGPQA